MTRAIQPVIVDAHLDVAWNALHNGRDLTRSVADLRADGTGISGVAMTSLGGFGRGGVALVVASLYASPAARWATAADLSVPGYTTTAEAEQQVLEQLALYERWADAGAIRLITGAASLEAHLAQFSADRVPGFLLALEGADPIASADHLPRWIERGVSMIGLAWGTTRYAGGTGSHEGLTAAGRDLLAAMAQLGVIHDASHLSEESFWEAVELPQHALCVSHANPRACMVPAIGDPSPVPLNRFLSDAQLAEVARPHGPAGATGVVGVTLLDLFLDPAWGIPDRLVSVTLRDQVAAHLHQIAGVAGWTCVGIGSDVDAGFGRDETPEELDSIADWGAIGDVVPEEARRDVLGENWLRFFRSALG